jgi:hypothetical protein
MYSSWFGLVRGQGDFGSLRIKPSLQLFGLRERRRGKKHIKTHIAGLAPEWADVEDPQNRLLKNALIFGLANERAPAGRA